MKTRAGFLGFRRGAVAAVLMLWAGLFSAQAPAGGLEWLAAQNSADGSYARPADIATAYQASAETLRTFQFFSHSPAGNAYSYLDNAASSDTESLARRLIARVANGQDATPLLAELLARQNADGGFGDLPGYDSTVLDSAFALEALAAVAGQAGASVISNGLQYLLAQQQAQGDWLSDDGATSLYVTALAALALEQYRQVYPLSAPITRAADFLLAQSVVGEAFETVLALLAARPVIQDASRFQNTLNTLQSAQLPDGSWGGEVYLTALALRALAPSSIAQSDFGTLLGVVVDGQTGLGLAGVAVQLSGTQSDTRATQSNGQFSFERLPAGQYNLQIGTALNSSVQLAAGQTLNLGSLRIFQDSVTRIQGTVSDAKTGAPLVGAQILVSGVNEPVSSDAQGRYQVDTLTAGQHLVQVSKAGYVSLGQTLEVAANTTLAYSPALLPDSVAVTGTVTDSANSQPLAGVQIRVNGIPRAQTDAQGHYSIESLPSGTLSLVAELTGYQASSGNAEVQPGTTVSFSPTLTANTVPVYSPGTQPNSVSVTGTVTDRATGQPLAGVQISANGTAVAQTDAQGVYHVDALAPGVFSLMAELAGYRGAFADINAPAGTLVAFSPTLVQIVPTAGLRGRLLDSVSRQPIAGVTVSFATASVISEADGAFMLEELAPGAGSAGFSHPQYRDNPLTLTLPEFTLLDLGEVALTPLDYQPVRGFRGVVMDAAANVPLPGAAIRVVFGTQTFNLTSDSAGLFDFSAPLDTPDGTLNFSATGFVSSTFSVSLAENEILDFAQVRLRPEKTVALLPDMRVKEVSAASSDPQTLALSGTVSATVENIGIAGAEQPFTLLAFYDANQNGVYDAESDLALGEAMLESLAAGASQAVDISVSGILPFRDAPVTVWADSGKTVVEGEEGNNIGTNIFICEVEQATQTNQEIKTFNPVVKWKSSYTIAHTPIVSPLLDTNKDGVIDGKDTPAVIGITNSYADGGVGVIALDGKTGDKLWFNKGSYNTQGTTPALGDIDGDGYPEIVVPLISNKMVAINNDGTTKWISKDNFSYSSIGHDAIVLTDLELDGRADVIYYNIVLNYDGSLKWNGQSTLNPTPIVADLDGDRHPEVLMGKYVYHSDGTLYWEFPYTAYNQNHMQALVNLDSDPYPEIVDMGRMSLSIFEHDGTLKRGPVNLPDSYNGGPPTIFDMDSDGSPEIGVAGSTYYRVFNYNLQERWRYPVYDGGGGTTSASFDLDGNGRVEILYQDESYFYIFDGATGNVLYKLRKGSPTWIEGPAVADVDNDGHADIILPWQIMVLQDADNAWAPTRGVWNQHDYHISNINDDGSIPRYETPSWLTHNTYRANLPLKQSGSDPTAGHLRMIDNGHGQPYSLLARIGNAGAAPANSLKIGFYAGNPATGGTLLGSVTLAGLAPGAYQDARLDGLAALPAGEIYAVADPDNAVSECNETNNSVHLNVDGLSLPPQLSASLATDAPEYGPHTQVNITYTVNNLSSPPVDAEAVVSILDAEGKPVAEAARQTIAQLAGGNSADFTAVWNSGATLAGDYRASVRIGEVQVFAPFTLTAGPAATLSLRASTDRAVYHTTDTVQIQSLAQNQSANALVSGAALEIRVQDPSGQTVFSEQRGLNDLAPNGSQTRLSPYAFQAATEGNYTVIQRILSNAGQVLAQASASYQVKEDPRLSLSAQVSVALSALFQGDTQTAHATVNNSGTLALNAQALRWVLAGVDSGEIAASAEFTLDLAGSGTQSISQAFTVSESLAPGNYGAVLQAWLNGAWQTLGYAVFTVKEKPIRIDASLSVGGHGAVLVLLDNCTGRGKDGEHHACLGTVRTHCDGEDDEHREGRSGDDRRGEADDDDDEQDEDGYCDCADPHGGQSSLATQQAFLETLLTAHNWAYTIISNEDDFTRELRSGAYSLYALFSEQEKLSEQVQDELTEAVYRGEGLLVAGAHDNRHHLQDALGIKYRGKWSKVTGLILNNSPLHNNANAVFQGDAQALRIDLAGAQSAGDFVLKTPQCESVGEGKNKRQTCVNTGIAITTRAYGEGASVSFIFDLLAQATQAGENSLFAELILAGLQAVEPLPPANQPGSLLPLTLSLVNPSTGSGTGQGIATPGRALIDACQNCELLSSQAETQTDGSLLWAFDLAEAQQENLSFWLRLPWETPSLALNARVQTGAEPDWRDYTTLTQNLDVLPQAAMPDALGQFAQLANQDKSYRQAQQRLSQAARWLEQGKYEEALKELVKAAGQLPAKADAHGPRLLIDHLIRSVARLANLATAAQ